MRKEKILITSAGGLTGTFLTRHFIKLNEYEIFGADASKNVPLASRLEACFQVPYCSDPKYIDYIRDIVKKEKID